MKKQKQSGGHLFQREVICKRNDNRVTEVRQLLSRKNRDNKRLYHVEGARFLWRALENGAHIHSVVYSGALIAPVHKHLIDKLRRLGIPIIEVTSEVFHSLAITENPQGMIALIRQRNQTLQQASPHRPLCWLALTTVQSPGNFGTIMRTAEAVGATGVFLLGPDMDPYHPATVRASMGSIFALQFVRATMDEFLIWKKANQFVLVGTSPQATSDYHTMRYPHRCVLFMGGERKGLSAEHQALCDLNIKIPMEASLDSLNLAIATSVILYEIYNQRRMPAPP